MNFLPLYDTIKQRSRLTPEPGSGRPGRQDRSNDAFGKESADMVLDHAQVVAAQVFILFLLIGIGFLAGKTRMVNETGLRQMTDLLLIFVTPCVIVRAFQIPFSVSLLRGLLIALASALVTHALGAVLTWFVFRRQIAAQNRVLRFSVVFTNCIFMCLPLLESILGSRGVFYGSVYIAVFNLAQWTYGVILMTGSRSRIKLRQALINPGTVAILIALPLFLARIVL
ncbi:MAG TPA: hypothetical protein DD640_10525, partial [Clostridiales bacterium]|nr:hypothetical protein [Clostridiales bacterium]